MTPTPPETAAEREIVAAAKEISEHPVPLWDCDEHDMQTLIAILSRHRSDQVERLTKALLHVRQRFADYWWNPDDGGGGDMRKVPEAVDEALASEGKTETGNTQGSAENAGSDLMSRQALPTGVTAGETASSSSPPPAESKQVNELRRLATMHLSDATAAMEGALNTQQATIERLEGEAKAIRDAREANLGICDYCGGTIWGVSGFVEMEKLRLHPLCVERRSVIRLSSNLAQAEATIASLQSRLDAAVKVIEHLAKQKKSSEMDELYMAEVGYGDCAKPSDLPWQDACEMMIDEARDYLAKQERT